MSSGNRAHFFCSHEFEMSDKQEALWAYWSRVNYFTHFAPLLHKMLITCVFC